MIQRGKYYIFQPFDNSEDIPMYYRSNYEIPNENLTSVRNYIDQKYGEVKETIQKSSETRALKKDYDLESVLPYYMDRPENHIVGIISKNTSNEPDIFKVRPPLKKSADKKRGTGIYSLTGATCATSKDKEFLFNVVKKLEKQVDTKVTKKTTREETCSDIKDLLLYLEKYSTTKDDNKMTYIMIPNDHPKYPFPFNLEDRVKYYLNKVKDIIKREFDHTVTKENNGTFLNFTKMKTYTIEIKRNSYIDANKSAIEKLGFSLNKGNYLLEIK